MRRLAASAALVLLLAAPARAADPIMPLAQVRAGMACTGLSVVRGTVISSFRVQVVDVIVGDAALGGARILVRVSGPAVAEGGIGLGFSGSPVLCRDGAGALRNAGAIAEGVSDYGNRLGLVTPIEEMLGESPTPPRSARRDARLLAAARPLATPLTSSGLAGPARALLARAARKAGTRALAAPAGPLGGYPLQQLRPGASAIAAVSTGDVSIGALGTVTYRDGASVWAFGHPLAGLGRRSLFLQDGYVFTVAANPLGIDEVGAVTQKLGSAGGHTVGTLTNDAPAAVVGRLGAGPPTVPLSVRARGGGRRQALDVRLADERALGHGAGLSLVAPLVSGTAVDGVLRTSAAPATLAACVRFRIGRRPRRFGFCNAYFDVEAALTDVARAAELVELYRWTPLRLAGMAVDLRARHGVREAVLLRASAPRRVRPGGRIAVRLRAQGPGGPVRTLRLRLRVPPWLRPGTRTLVLEGTGGGARRGSGDELEEILLEDLAGERDPDAERRRREPRSLRALVERVEALRRPLGIRARFGSGPRRIVHLGGETLYSGRASVRLRVVARRRR